MDYQKIIDNIYSDVLSTKDEGKIASYIPELGLVNPDQFGVFLKTVDGRSYACGDSLIPFSIQSIAKVFTLAIAFRLDWVKIWNRVGVEPSGNPYNSLVQLEHDKGIPRNPMINAGALVVCDILLSALENPQNELLNFVRTVANDQSICYDLRVAASERSVGYRNAALANYIKSFGNIENDVEKVLNFYYHICSIHMNCCQLAEAFSILANNGFLQNNSERILGEGPTKRINAIMLTCGFYDEAGEFTYKVGLPGKSGVGGGIVAIYPNYYSIAVWSPRLNAKGNSSRGLSFLENFTSATGQSIF